jgi:uncharacterized membrane protein
MMEKNILTICLSHIVKAVTLVGIFLIVGGMTGLLISALKGGISIAILLFIPVIMMSGPVPVISIVLMTAGLIMIVYSRWIGSRGKGASREQGTWGGVVLIGPFPILFGSLRGSIPFYLRVILGSIGFLMFVSVILVIISMLI